MRARPDDILSMIVFARVVEARSFTEAARRLELSKSAVSARVSRLEEHLGVRLLHRTTRRLSLTDDGLRLYEHCARLVEEADEAALVAAGAADEPRGTLRLNAPVAFAELELAAPIAAFLERYEAVRVELTLQDRLVDVVEEGLDVVIRVSHRLADSSLLARKLATDTRVLCASPDYLRRFGAPETPRDLVHHNCLHYGLVRLEEEWRFLGPAGPFTVPVTPRLTVDNGRTLALVAAAGAGLVVVPRFMVAPELRAGLLREILPAATHMELGIWAVHAHVKHVPAKVRAFVDHLADWFREPPWADA